MSADGKDGKSLRWKGLGPMAPKAERDGDVSDESIRLFCVGSAFAMAAQQARDRGDLDGLLACAKSAARAHLDSAAESPNAVAWAAFQRTCANVAEVWAGAHAARLKRGG